MTNNVNQYNEHIQNKSYSNQSTYLCENEKKPAKRHIVLPNSAEYGAADGRRHVIPPNSQHSTAEVVFDNGGKEPKIGNFPTNMSRFMKGRDFDQLIEQINAPSTNSTKLATVSKTETSYDATSTKPLGFTKVDKWRQEEMKQIKSLTVRIIYLYYFKTEFILVSICIIHTEKSWKITLLGRTKWNICSN